MNDYVCPKCGGTHCEVDTINVTGSGLSKIFDLQNRAFSTVSCSKCKYTELYKATTSDLMNILDFLS